MSIEECALIFHSTTLSLTIYTNVLLRHIREPCYSIYLNKTLWLVSSFLKVSWWRQLYCCYLASGLLNLQGMFSLLPMTPFLLIQGSTWDLTDQSR